DGIALTPPAETGEDFDASIKRTDFVILAAIAAVAAAVVLQLGSRIEPGLGLGIDDYSVAVLPLVEVGATADQRYFALGMQASLIAALSQVQRVRVTSKVSTMQYGENADLSLKDIGRALNVSKVIEGLVTRRGNQVSIAVQLFDAREDRNLWSATFEDELDNINFLQSRIALEVANQIKVDVTDADRARLTNAKSVNPEAYLAFLRGVFHVERYNPEDMQIAQGHFQRAIEIDPEYAQGYWGLAKLCAFMGQAGVLTPDEARAQCRPPLERALELDPFLPEAYLGMASFLTWQDFDFEAARPQFERAIELNPSYAEAHMFYSHYLGIIGELDKSTEHMQTALELDPLNPFLMGLHSIQLCMIGDYEAAVDAAEASVAAPGVAFGYITLQLANNELGNYDEAVEALANSFEFIGGNPEVAAATRALYAELGYEGMSLALAEQMEAVAATEHVPPIIIGSLYYQSGDVENAVAWFRRAYERSDPDSPYLGVNVKDPRVRAHPDFQALLREMGLDYWADEASTHSP
ncbi:MAG: tetratricopeptide repeat protein, partial [Pseudomonadota bacterium]